MAKKILTKKDILDWAEQYKANTTSSSVTVTGGSEDEYCPPKKNISGGLILKESTVENGLLVSRVYCNVHVTKLDDLVVDRYVPNDLIGDNCKINDKVPKAISLNGGPYEMFNPNVTYPCQNEVQVKSTPDASTLSCELAYEPNSDNEYVAGRFVESGAELINPSVMRCVVLYDDATVLESAYLHCEVSETTNKGSLDETISTSFFAREESYLLADGRGFDVSGLLNDEYAADSTRNQQNLVFNNSRGRVKYGGTYYEIRNNTERSGSYLYLKIGSEEKRINTHSTTGKYYITNTDNTYSYVEYGDEDILETLNKDVFMGNDTNYSIWAKFQVESKGSEGGTSITGKCFDNIVFKLEEVPGKTKTIKAVFVEQTGRLCLMNTGASVCYITRGHCTEPNNIPALYYAKFKKLFIGGQYEGTGNLELNPFYYNFLKNNENSWECRRLPAGTCIYLRRNTYLNTIQDTGISEKNKMYTYTKDPNNKTITITKNRVFTFFLDGSLRRFLAHPGNTFAKIGVTNLVFSNEFPEE